MTGKTEIIKRLGEAAVLLPSLIGEALAANDRVKERFSRLQAAKAGADRTGAASSGVRAVSATHLALPGARAEIEGIAADLDAMLAPLAAAGAAEAARLAGRVRTARAGLPAADDDQIGRTEIDAICAAGPDDADSVHRLVMDLHRAINRLATDIAIETIDGASVHGLTEPDAGLVRAFMRGLHRTAPLAFGHPGLGTTAVRAGRRLTIQNDIGATDAHVLVVNIEGDAATLTYTDIHRQRSQFFADQFRAQNVTWNRLDERASAGMEKEQFYLLTGRRDCADAADLARFLEFLASRIVFLIDWNKARKALQPFVSRAAAVGLLRWAADNDLGHRAFVELGGQHLVFDAINRAAASRMPYGTRLDEALGEAACAEFLRGVLRVSSEGLRAGRSTRLIRDQIQTDLARLFETAESGVLAVLVRHLGLTRTLAGAIADLLAVWGGATREAAASLAARAKRIEGKADVLTVAAREAAARLREGAALRTAIDEVETTTDVLEDCAFMLSLVPRDAAGPLPAETLGRLAQIVTDGAGHLVRAVECVSRLPGGERADAADALEAIEAVMIAEHDADAAERDTLAALMAAPAADARLLALPLEIARALEEATDHLSHAALSLRQRVLAELAA